VERTLHVKQAIASADVASLALDTAHAVAFHNGLGDSIYPAVSSPYQKYMNEEHISSYADVVYTKPNIAVVADGASPDSLSKWTSQFFKDLPASAQSGQVLKTTPSKYYGGEQRLTSKAGNAMVIAFPGSDYASPKAEIAVLAALLGGQPTIKWAPGFSLLSKATGSYPGLSVSAKNLAYSDAGLLTIQLSGNAASVRHAATDAVKALNSVADGSVSKEDVTKAIANAKFNALDEVQLRGPSLLLAGSGIVNSGKAFDLAALAKSIDGVTADKLKTVSPNSLYTTLRFGDC
jgi:ubiquinol-cytochrome c reductase core subunit 2